MFFRPIWVLGPRGGGVSQGIGTQPAMQFMQFVTLGSSKIEVFEICFFDTVIT